MLNFPNKSINLANEIVSKYRKRTNSKLEIAAHIYHKKFHEIDYGFDEAIKDGNCGKYLHELVKQGDCFVWAGAAYLLAKQAGLNPIFYEATGMKDVEEGQDPDKKSQVDHCFITVEIGKNKTQIIDNNLNVFGIATFNSDKHEIKIYNKTDDAIWTRKYDSLDRLSEQDYLKKLEQARTPSGGRNALSCGQKISPIKGRSTLVTYLSKNHSLKTSLHFNNCLYFKDTPNQATIIDLKTPIMHNGLFNINQGKFSFYNAANSGWSSHNQPQEPLEISFKDANKIWKIWQSAVHLDGRKSPVYDMSPDLLENSLIKLGFNDFFELTSGSKAEKILEYGTFSKEYQEFLKSLNSTIASYLPKAQAHEITNRVLLRNAQFIKQREKAKSKTNPQGLLFTREECFDLIEKEFGKYKRYVSIGFRNIIETNKIGCGLKKGSKYYAKRKARSSLNRMGEESDYLGNMGGTLKFRGEEIFLKQIRLDVD